MIQKHKVMYKRIALVTGAVLLLLTGFFAGRLGRKTVGDNPASYDTNRQVVKANVKTIAVVNSDTGTYVNDEYMNYASRLLDFLDENYVITNLEAARTGIEDGTYAAYILIPSSFSENLVSLNTKPVKVSLEYAINGSLVEERRVETVYRIVDFERNLNSEMSYMYLSSILDEFHDVQDGAQVIMDNDRKEIDVISAIQPVDLVEMVPVPELVRVENSIEPLDVTDYNGKNTELISEIDNSYTYFLNLSEKDLAALKDQGSQLTEQWNQTENMVQSIKIHTDEEGDLIYEKGLEEIEEWLLEYNTVLLTEKEDEVEEKAEELSAFLNEQADELELLADDYDTALALEKKEVCLEILAVMDEAAARGESVSANDIGAVLDNHFAMAGSGAEMLVSERLRQEGRNIQERIEQETLFEIPRIDMETLSEQVEEKVVLPVAKRLEAIQEEMNAGYEDNRAALQNYSALLTDYDPMENVDKAVIQEYIGGIQENNILLHTTVVENYQENMEYVRDVYESTEENISVLQENILDSRELNNQAVEEGLREAKEVKSSTSEVNQALLADFSVKLPYTRIGNLENTQACDFIVDPVRLKNLGDIEMAVESAAGGKMTVKEIRAEERSTKPAVVWYVLLVMLIVSLTGALVCSLIKKNADGEKEKLIF